MDTKENQVLGKEKELPLTKPPLIWHWKGHKIAYQQQGNIGVSVVLIHGFGASWGHWRKNIPALAEKTRCYAIDLIGFGASAKPEPGREINYTFETWAEQIADFCREVVGRPVVLIGNSIGCIVAMQTAVFYPDLVLGITAINFSLRMLHDRKREALAWYERLGAPLLQKLLKQKGFGYPFFKLMAQPRNIRQALFQAYQRHEAVTDELVNMLYQPALDRGAADVFIAFTTYSQGPIPEDLLPIVPCPILILWGNKDPWESIELGRKIAETCPQLENFIPLEGLGHCPQDEAPEIVNPLLLNWLAEHPEFS